MELTTSYLREHFADFNRRYFGGELPVPRFRVTNARTQLGQFSCRRAAVGAARWLPSWWLRRKLADRQAPATDYQIKISEYYDVPEEEYQNVLLHEMIHYYIAYKGIRDTSSHGREFRRLMNWLNAEHGWHIRVSTRTKAWPVSSRNQARRAQPQHVIAVTLTDGRHLLGVINAAYVQQVDRLAARAPQVKTHEWFRSADPWFADFPRSRTLRGRRVSAEFFAEMTRKMREEQQIS